MQAVILAAGKGSRLGALTADRPKCLLEVGGRPLLGHSLDHLEAAGCVDAVVVTGHCGDALREEIGDRHGGVAIRYVDNPHFEAAGSMGSLLAAALAMDSGSFLLLESDLLYHPGFLTAALDGAGSIMLAADISGSGDEVFMCRDPDGTLIYLGKNPPEEIRRANVGEFAGISKIEIGFYRKFRDAAKRLVRDDTRDVHYENVLFALARAGRRLKVRPCPGLPWTEVDTPADLERARTVIWPKIRAAD